MAAFAVSAYASTYYRAGSKPFNPVLGETYECVRPDRGFRFISEQVGTGGSSGGTPKLGGALARPSLSPQVSHHPPISACHAESDNFVFWQGESPGGRRALGESPQKWGDCGGVSPPPPSPPDMRWKNKFWGKSLEIVPMGTVNVQLPR